MAKTIQELLDDIQNASYGRDVRDAIHDSIARCYANISTAKTLADDATAAANSAASDANDAASRVEAAERAGNDIASKINGYATTASNSAAAAKTSETNALSYRNAANTSATNAKTSETNAKTSETNALSYRNAANTSATNAATSESNARTYMTRAEAANADLQEVYQPIMDASEAATTARDEAVSAATAAQNAQTAAEAARDRAETAVDAAESANADVQRVYQPIMDAAGSVESIMNDIESAATRAETAATTAENSIRDAETAIAAANTAADNTNAVITRAETATSNANTAASNANTATTNANNSANSANNAASNANSAASLANAYAAEARSAVEDYESIVPNVRSIINNWPATDSQIQADIIDMEEATSRAEAAAEMIEDMEVTSTAVDEDTPGSADISEEDGHKVIHFNLQQGKQGKSYTILGSAFATVEDLEENVFDPEVGDQYNVGTSAPYNVYRWTGEEWEDQGTIGVVNTRTITNADIETIYSGETVTDKDRKYLDVDGLTYHVTNKIKPALDAKVNAVAGKGLSTNDFTNELKAKIDTNATNVTVLTNNKVDKVEGKGLSTNDFTTTYLNRVNSNASAVTSLQANKLDKDFSTFTEISSGIWASGLFSVYYDGAVYKLGGQDFVNDLTSIGNYVQNNQVGTMSEFMQYLGIADDTQPEDEPVEGNNT